MTADTIAFSSSGLGLHFNSEQPHILSAPSSDILSGVPSMESEDGASVDDELLSKVSTTHQLRLSFTMLVTEKTLTSLKSSARTQVSILRNGKINVPGIQRYFILYSLIPPRLHSLFIFVRKVADLYNLSSYDMVTITRIEKSDEPAVLEEVSADFVMVTIKDQFISRADMHYFQKFLIGRWIYEGERLSQSKTVSKL